MSAKAIAIIAGVGTGTGSSVAHAFAAKGYAVALLSRTLSNLEPIADSIRKAGGVAEPIATDTSSTTSIHSAFDAVRAKWPDYPVRVAVYNGHSGFVRKPFLEIQESEIRSALEGRMLGAFTFAQLAIKAFKEKEDGKPSTLIFTGATAAMKGSALFSVFAAGSFATRALSQSLAREFHPQNIHVAHVIVDGVIDIEKTRVNWPSEDNKDNAGRLDPEEIAKSYVYLHEQAPNSWTQELDLRPAREKW